jgi:cephalosporin hydroxylase
VVNRSADGGPKEKSAPNVPAPRSVGIVKAFATIRRASSGQRLVCGIDVVIDDGSHIVPHQMAALDFLFPLVSEGGIYMCEDLQTNYWSEFEGF